LQPKILLRGVEHMAKLVFGNSLPFALVLSLQPLPDFWDLGKRNGEGQEGAGRMNSGPE
jgi:hypothetical protein